MSKFILSVCLDKKKHFLIISPLLLLAFEIWLEKKREKKYLSSKNRTIDKLTLSSLTFAR